MKHFRFYLVFLAVLVLCTGEAFGSPKAVIENPQYNAGIINQGTVIFHDFIVKNTGDMPLELKVNDCGCGGVKAKTPNPVKPGKSDVIKVSIPTVNRKGDFRRDIKIETNGPAGKETVITITAKINPVITAK